MSRAQASIETLIILAIAMVSLAIFSGIIWNQVSTQYVFEQQQMGSEALRTLTREINDVYFLGPGSVKEVTIKMPDLIDFDRSSISNNTLLLNIGGSDIFSSADVNVVGIWPNTNGSYVFRLVSFGRYVSISSDLLSFSPAQISESISQGSSKDVVITVKNLSPDSASYVLRTNFSSAYASINSAQEGETINFTGSEEKELSFSLSCSSDATGNYSGEVVFAADINAAIPVNINCTSSQSNLTILPQTKTVSFYTNTSSNETFLVCNNSKADFPYSSISVGGDIQQITSSSFTDSISANSCKQISVRVNSPEFAGTYSGTFSVLSGGLTASTTINVVANYNFSTDYSYAFLSVVDSNISHYFNYPGFLKARTLDSSWTSTGEVDWNNFSSNVWSSPGVVTKYDNSSPTRSDSNSTNGRIPPGSADFGDSYVAGYPTVIKDGSDYKMWYSGYGSSYYQTFYAYSSDGLTWTKNDINIPAASNTIGTNGRIPRGGSGTGDYIYSFGASVIKDDADGNYKMWYTGYGSDYHYRIFYATSLDGLTWDKVDNSIPSTSNSSSTNGRIPLGTDGTGDDYHAGFPSVVKAADGNYLMWYSGHDGSYYRIYYATSPDGLTWTKYDNSVPSASDSSSTNGRVPLGNNAKGDDYSVYLSNVIQEDDNSFSMWYSGHNGGNVKIFYATSPDGLTWTKYDNSEPNPSRSDATSQAGKITLGNSGRGDAGHAYMPAVIKDGSDYKMWYCGYDYFTNMVYYATSSDGVTWTKYNNIMPDLSDTTSTDGRIPTSTNLKGDSVYTYMPSILKDDDGNYHMWYVGYGYPFGYLLYYAYSSDGINWTKYDNNSPRTYTAYDTVQPAGHFFRGSNTKGDDTYFYQSSMIKDGNTYKMWYSGHDGANLRIFYATSPDAITWTKYNNTIPSASNTTSTDGRIPLGSGSVGDSVHAYLPSVLKDDDGTYKMWYTGYGSDSKYRIYYATSPDGLTWTKYDNSIPSASDLVGTNGRIPIGNNGTGDDYYLGFASVVKSPDGIYHMFYSGHDGSNSRIFHAYSLDGLTWYKNAYITPETTNSVSGSYNIPLGSSSFGDDYYIYYSTVILDGNYFKIWYNGYDGGQISFVSIFYATVYAGNTSWDTNLLHYFKFNEKYTNTIVDSARGTSGLLYSGATLSNGLWDSNALYCDGSNDYVGVGNFNDVNHIDTTFSAWINPGSNSTTGTIVGEGKLGDAGNVYRSLRVYNGKLDYAWASANSNYKVYTSDSNLPINEWVHVAVTQENYSTPKLYINGLEASSILRASAGTARQPSVTTLSLCRHALDYGLNYFKGFIDDLKIYDKVLSPQEIFSDYNSFLSARLVDKNIFNSGVVSTWDSIKLNSSVGYDFGKEIENWGEVKEKGINELGSSPDINDLFTDQNILALWHMNDNMVDVIGPADGYSSPTYRKGLYDTNAVYCDGATNFHFTNSSSHLNVPQFTFNAWIFPQSTSGTRGFYTHGGGNGYSAGFRLFHDSTNQRAVAAWGSGAVPDGTLYAPVGGAPNGTWLMFTSTYDGSAMRIYVNGVLQAIDDTVAYAYSSTASGSFCRCDGCSIFVGPVDETALWSRALSDSEIKRIYDFQKPVFAGALSGLWHLDNNAGDSSGNNLDGSLTGSNSYSTGLWGTSDLNSSGVSYVSVPENNLLDGYLTGSISVSAWVKWNGTGSVGRAWEWLVTKNSDGSATNGYYLANNYDGSQIRFQVNSVYAGISYSNLVKGKWYHLVGTARASGYVKLYVDGVLASTSSGTLSAFNDSSNNLNIGNAAYYSSPIFNGHIEEVAVWNKELSADEVMDLYRKGVSTLDINVYSCSDALCETKLSSQYVSDTNNGLWMDISSLTESKYFGLDAFFRAPNDFSDMNNGFFWVGSYLKDFNVSYRVDG